MCALYYGIMDGVRQYIPYMCMHVLVRVVQERVLCRSADVVHAVHTMGWFNGSR